MRRALAERPAEAVEVSCSDGAIVVRFAAPHRVCSWAIVNGGLRVAREVGWIRVHDAELAPPVDARRLLRERLVRAGAPDAIGLLTSRDLETFEDVTVRDQEASARVIATVGLGNALRAGDPPGPTARIGTINLLCRVSTPLTDEALLEAMAIATEARTAAILDAGVPSVRTRAPATGTGTDCVVVAAPVAPRPAVYAGKHTSLGHVIGASVARAVARGAERWKRERGMA
jgi:adenosylcobinamide amidohydrolase